MRRSCQHVPDDALILSTTVPIVRAPSDFFATLSSGLQVEVVSRRFFVESWKNARRAVSRISRKMSRSNRSHQAE